MLELIIKNKYFSVLGNHEQMMIDTADGQNPNVYWFPNGGRETLDSYHGLINNKYTDMHKKHLKWLRNLPYFIYFEIDTHKPLVVSHSYIHHVWINKDHEYCKCDGRDILWRHMNNKHLFESSKESENAIFNIFGHTPVKESVITDCYAMIDTGAVYSHKKGYGKLSAIHYPSLEVLNVKQ
jgi:serine/threonine protein phosphatase 1